jgi:cytochrome P450
VTAQPLIASLYDLRSARNEYRGGGWEGDFHGTLRGLREAGSVHEGAVADLCGVEMPSRFLAEPPPIYTTFGWDACMKVWRTPEIYSSKGYDLFPAKFFGRNMLAMDGDEHKQHRTLVQPKFLRKQTQWWVERFVTGAAEELVAALEQDGRADLNLQLCALLPLLTITGSFGVSAEEAIEYADLVYKMLGQDAAERETAAAELAERTLALAAERRMHPHDDLLSHLAASEIVTESGDRQALDDEEISGFSRLLIGAGLDTTWRQMGALFFALLIDPPLLDEVRRNRALLGNAIEEVMRWETNAPVMRRLTTQPTSLEGVDIPAGALVEICIAAANRDPSRYEHPDVFDVHRTDKPHMAFGNGPHVCLGMHVARAEIEIAASLVLDRLPNVRLDPDAEPPRIVGFDQRGPTALPVVWDV